MAADQPGRDGSTAAPARPRRAGRPTSAVLSPAQITRSALELIAENGYGALTMAALARRLGVAPSALYNHVASKQQLMQWIQDDVMARVDHACFARLPLPEALRQWATSYRDTIAEHVPLIPVIAVLPVVGSPRTIDMYEAVAAGLAGAGWPEERIVPTIVAFESFIFGSALDTTAPEDIFDTAGHPRPTPAFDGAREAQRATGERPAEASFRVGLEGLIAGVVGAAG